MTTSVTKSETTVESMCRLCLRVQEYSQSIFGKDDSLQYWIENLTSLKIMNHPNAPASLCSECETTLRSFELFRKMCITNDTVFKKLYLQDYQPEHLENNSAKNDAKIEHNESDENEMCCLDPTSFSEDDVTYAVEYLDIETETDARLSWNEGQAKETPEQKRLRKKAHIAEIRKKLCPICNTKVSALGTHLKSHREYKPFQCEYCSKTFNMMCNLNKHIRRHLQLKTFICSYCEKGFTNSAELNVHLRIHTNEKPYKCNECDKPFRTAGCLNRHVQSIHKKMRPHTCEVCQVKFTLAAHLRRHMLRHTLERPYGCSICNRNYSRLDLLKAHSCRP